MTLVTNFIGIANFKHDRLELLADFLSSCNQGFAAGQIALAMKTLL